MKKLPLLILTLFIISQSFAVNVTITGTVTNRLSSMLLPDHEIKLVDFKNSKDTIVTHTNKRGYYSFSLETDEFAEIHVITEGYYNEETIIYKKSVFISQEIVEEVNFFILYEPKLEHIFTVSGFVKQIENNKPLKNYPVNLYKSINLPNKITIYTDKKGFYTYTYELPPSYSYYALLETKGNCNNEWTNYTDTIKSYESDYSKDFYICHDSLWYMQDFIINGFVFNEETNEPVANHPIFIISKNLLSQNSEIYTDENGFFIDTLKFNIQNNSEFDIRTYSYCDDKQITHYNNTVTAFVGTYYEEFLICVKDDLPSEDCDISFFYYQSREDLKVYFFDFSDNNITNKTWVLGDGTTKTGSNIEHTYSEEGVYNVCLTAETDLGCTVEFCKKIVVGESFGFTGKVYASGIELPEGIVTLFKYEGKSESYKYTNYAQVSDGTYNIEEMITGNYLLFAVPFFDVDYNYFPKYLPTYFGEKYSWQNANPILIDKNTENLDINLLKYNEIFYGQAEISGHVDLNENAEKEQITVVLFNEKNIPMDFRILDNENNFIFPQLPYGTYRVRTECAGKYSTVCHISVSDTEPSSPKINFIVNENDIDFFVVNIDYVVSNENINVFPNPFYDKINIHSNFIGDKNIEIEIFDISGKLIYSEISINNYDNIELKEDFSNQSKGVYFLHISTDNKIIYKQKLLKI